MKNLTADYCERRALEEKQAAAAASCHEAELVHRKLAREFAARAQELRANAQATGRESSRPILSPTHHQ